MLIKYLYKLYWFVGLILFQVLVLNNIHIGGLATPFLYVYFILKFDSSTTRNELMMWAFFMGILIDVFFDSPGMHAAATVLLAFVRPTLLRLFTPRDAFDSIVPSMRTMGTTFFYKYLFSALLVHHTALLMLGFFSLGNLLFLLVKILSCTVFTALCITTIEWLRRDDA